MLQRNLLTLNLTIKNAVRNRYIHQFDGKWTREISKRLFVIGLLFFLLFCSHRAFSQYRLDVNEATKILDSLNIDILQLHHQTTLAKQDIKDAKNALIPKLNASVSRNYNFGLAFDQVAGQLITGNRWTNSANANISTQVSVFQGFALRNQVKDALLDLEIKHIEMRALKRSLKLQLLQIYYMAITNKALYRSGLEQSNYSKEQLRIQREQFEIGTKTTVDVSLAESQVATDEFNLLNINTNYLNSILELKQLLNIPLDDSLVLEEPTNRKLPIMITPKNIESTSPIWKYNPFIQQSELAIEKAKLAQKIASNSRLPSLSFSGGYGTNYSSQRTDLLTGSYMPFWDQVNQNRSLYFGFSLSVPIFDGFSVRSAKNRANIEMAIQQSEKEKVQMEQEKIYQHALQNFHLAKQEHSVAQKQFKSLKTALVAMSERYQLGVASSVDFAKAVLDHNQAEFNAITAYYNLHYQYEIVKLLSTVE